MRPFRHAALALWSLSAASLLEPLQAAPAPIAAPTISSNRIDVQQICHHYRWSSRRHCTSAKVLRHYDRRPKLHYPSRYYADRPHYYYEQRNFYYWRTYPWYAHHRWYRWPYYYGWPYRYPYYW